MGPFSMVRCSYYNIISELTEPIMEAAQVTRTSH